MKEFPHAIRNLLVAALPEDPSLHGKTPELRYTYLPATHAKALRPDNMLVVGMRGSGKSFWWSALQQKEHLTAIGSKIGISDNTTTSTGFGEKISPDNYPGKDVISSLLKSFESRQIWLTVVLLHVCGDQLSPEFMDQKSWENRVRWVLDNPEPVERCLFEVDNTLNRKKRYHLVLFDALDRTADDWKTMNSLLRGLLQVLLDFRSFNRIRLKVFVRPDQIEDSAVSAFPDASKVLSQKTELNWSRNELYGLLWQYLANEPLSGDIFRNGCGEDWKLIDGIWPVPDQLRNDEELQRQVFHAITGPWMGRDKRRGFPYTWLYNHLLDSKRQVSPRSFLAALRHAGLDKIRIDQKNALHYESIKLGVQEATKIRVFEIQEDYPWIKKFMEPLSGISVPCEFGDIERIWEKKGVLEDLANSIETEGVRLPPAHIGKGTEGVFDDISNIGIFERTPDGRVNLPDVYRVGYGIGRRGGVKPVG